MSKDEQDREGAFKCFWSYCSFMTELVLSHVWLLATPWTVAHQAPLSMGFPSQKHWSGLPFPPPGDLPDLEVNPMFLALAGRFFTTGKPLIKSRVFLFH